MSDVLSFNCTQCGAGQDLRGGGRVRVHVCGYCGAELDVQDDFRVIAQFRDMVRPETPFDLGMEGTLWGVPFTVIGTIGWIEQYGRSVWEWTDHQVYSPTHGYAWLTVDEGHIVFTRKVRDLPNPPFIGDATIESSEHRPTAEMKGKTYRYYGSGTARPVFIEGAFNFVPGMEMRSRYVELVCGHEMLTMAGSSGEREYELSTLPDPVEVVESFGISPDRYVPPAGIHVLEEFQRSPTALFVRNTALAAGVAAVVLGFALHMMGREVLVSDRVSLSSPQTFQFEVTEGDRLTEIGIWADVYNSWAAFEAELLDAEGEPVAGFEREVGYYAGVEGGESWSEGSRTVKTRVKLPAGTYTLEVAQTEAEIDWSGGQLARQMYVRVSEGHTNPFWLYGVGALFLLIGGGFLLQRAHHNSRRWSGSDWSDD